MGGTACPRSCAGSPALPKAAKPGERAEERSIWFYSSRAPTGAPRQLVLISLYADPRGWEVIQAPDSPGTEYLPLEKHTLLLPFFFFF